MKLLTLLLAVPAALALQTKESHEAVDYYCVDYLRAKCDTDQNWIIDSFEADCANTYAAQNNKKRWKEKQYIQTFCRK